MMMYRGILISCLGCIGVIEGAQVQQRVLNKRIHAIKQELSVAAHISTISESKKKVADSCPSPKSFASPQTGVPQQNTGQ